MWHDNKQLSLTIVFLYFFTHCYVFGEGIVVTSKVAENQHFKINLNESSSRPVLPANYSLLSYCHIYVGIYVNW